jgi:hypothetical protein
MNGHLYFSNMSRRDFLSKTAKTVMAVGTGLTLEGLLANCATVKVPESEPNLYPDLPGQKIQPPKNGCLVGLMRHYATISYTGNVSKDAGRIIDYYQEKLGKKPAFFSLCCGVGATYFPQEEMEGLATRGVIPNILPEYPQLDEISKGNYDTALTNVAKEATQYGKQHGGFFYTPMWHPNGKGYFWCGNSTGVKNAWKHVWQIFEDNGANEYATWLWEVATNESYCGHADNPHSYYPGDKYVDWIGFSAYSRAMYDCTNNKSFNELVTPAYSEMRRTHPDKPIMQAEFGKTKGHDQPHWVKNAYKTIKSLPGMKAALYWDWPDIGLNDDLQLSDKSYAVLKEILKDPYWITAKGA